MNKEKTEKCKSCGKVTKIDKDIICNKCGKSCKVYLTADKKHTDFEGLLGVEVAGGFGSSHDCTTLKFDICDECLMKFIKTFKVKPEEIEVTPWASTVYVTSENATSIFE